MAFLDSLDIANRALFHLGATRISGPTENSKNNTTMAFLYDKLRRAELRRNVWRFATRRAVMRAMTTTTMNVVPAQWSITQTYLPGALVSDANGNVWISQIADNLGNLPGQSLGWDEFFGTLVADIYAQVSNYTAWSSGTTYATGAQVSYNGAAYQSLQSANTNNIPSAASSPWWFPISVAGPSGYYAGEIVYMPIAGANNNAVPGGFVAFLSLVNGNTTVPSVPAAWTATSQYAQDAVVSYGGSQWRSLIPLNQNNTPATAPAAWVAATSYVIGNTVTGPDGFVYSSLVNSNLGNNPETDSGTHWSPTGAVAAWDQSIPLFPSDTSWLPLYASLQPMTFIYPVGSGPSSATQTRNVFPLPNGFLREAPQDPKRGSVSFLGAPSGLPYEDWEFENEFLVSRDPGPLVFRFVADTINVQNFDDMFCEGLAARLGLEACEDINQSDAKKAVCAQEYSKFMGEARIVNAIETGATEPPEDDWITCRA